MELNSADLRWITSLEGRLVRVGVALIPDGDMWPLGFEVVRAGRSMVHRYWIDKAEGQQLYDSLKVFAVKDEEQKDGGREPL